MNDIEAFRDLPRSERKRVLYTLHTERVKLHQAGLDDSEDYQKLVQTIKALEAAHHDD